MTHFLTIDSKLPPYMVFPRFLLNTDLSETTKILYIILLDRTRLSIKNGGWSNNQGHVYIHFTISELADTLSKSEMTIKNSLSALEKADLIYRQRQGIGLPNKIYVKFPNEAFSPVDKKSSLRQKENFPSDGQKIISPTDTNVSTNKNKRSNNYSANQPYNQRNYESEEYESL